MEESGYTAGKAPAVHGDECDITIEHGPCNPDGSPRRYRSKSELRAVEKATGWRPYERGDERVGAERQRAYEDRQTQRDERARRVQHALRSMG